MLKLTIAALTVAASAVNCGGTSTDSGTTTTTEVTGSWVVESVGWGASKGWGKYRVTCVPQSEYTEDPDVNADTYKDFDITPQQAAFLDSGDPCPDKPATEVKPGLPACPTSPEMRTPELMTNCVDVGVEK